MTEKNGSSIEQFDSELHWHCPQLGGEVTFQYCRKLLGGLPCGRVLDCWRTIFDVHDFLARHYNLKEIAAAWGRPRPNKIVQLADLVDQASKASSRSPAADGPNKDRQKA